LSKLAALARISFKKLPNAINYLRFNGFRAFLRRIREEFSGTGYTPALVSMEQTSIAQVLRERFPAIQPLPSFIVPGVGDRLNVVTDSINSGSLFGGVSTSLILSALLAERWNCDLRIVTRTAPAQKQNFQRVLQLNQIPFDRNVEFVFVNQADPGAQLSVGEREVFLTTSWWTTKSVMGTFGHKRIVYLLQEDEREFYPFGDDHLRCSATLRTAELRVLINTELLYDHLVNQGFDNIRDNGVWFEPSFPARVFDHPPQQQKRNFFFYARPRHVRNLFYLGLEVIEAAVSQGILDPNEWEFYFVGTDIPRLNITNSCSARLVQDVDYGEYTALVRQMDLGLCLMYTPHPSYPPLDLVASGAVVVTNKYANKQDLSSYSRNILCEQLDVDSLVEGIEKGVGLAKNLAARRANFESNRLLHNWHTSFEAAMSDLDGWRSGVYH
jgi:hypothetical protein